MIRNKVENNIEEKTDVILNSESNTMISVDKNNNRKMIMKNNNKKNNESLVSNDCNAKMTDEASNIGKCIIYISNCGFLETDMNVLIFNCFYSYYFLFDFIFNNNILLINFIIFKKVK